MDNSTYISAIKVKDGCWCTSGDTWIDDDKVIDITTDYKLMSKDANGDNQIYTLVYVVKTTYCKVVYNNEAIDAVEWKAIDPTKDWYIEGYRPNPTEVNKRPPTRGTGVSKYRIYSKHKDSKITSIKINESYF